MRSRSGSPAPTTVQLITMGIELLGRSHPGDVTRRLAVVAHGHGRGGGRGPHVDDTLVLDALVEAGVVDRADAQFVVVADCRGFSDPARTALRNHLGTNAQNLRGFAGHPEFRAWARKTQRCIAAQFAEGRRNTVVAFCKKGRHRSVAAAAVLEAVMASDSVAMRAPVMHLAKRYWWQGACGMCPLCAAASDEKRRILDAAVAEWRRGAR